MVRCPFAKLVDGNGFVIGNQFLILGSVAPRTAALEAALRVSFIYPIPECFVLNSGHETLDQPLSTPHRLIIHFSGDLDHCFPGALAYFGNMNITHNLALIFEFIVI